MAACSLAFFSEADSPSRLTASSAERVRLASRRCWRFKINPPLEAGRMDLLRPHRALAPKPNLPKRGVPHSTPPAQIVRREPFSGAVFYGFLEKCWSCSHVAPFLYTSVPLVGSRRFSNNALQRSQRALSSARRATKTETLTPTAHLHSQTLRFGSVAGVAGS